MQIIEVIRRSVIQEAWDEKFIKSRGLEYFINYLFPSIRNLLDPSSGAQRFLCVKLLLQVIVTLSIIEAPPSAPKVKEFALTSVIHSSFIQTLADLMIALSAIPSSSLSLNEASHIDTINLSSLTWLGSLLCLDFSMLGLFLRSENFSTWCRVILFHSNHQIRNQAALLLENSCPLAPETHELSFGLFNHLNGMLDEINQNYRRLNPYVNPYFLLLTKFTAPLRTELDGLVQRILSIMRNNRQVYIETEYNKDEVDQILLGLLYLSGNVFISDPNLKLKYGPAFIEEVCDVCLFELPRNDEQSNTNTPKFKSPSSRSHAYQFLLHLCSACPDNYLLIVNKLRGIQDSLSFPNWNISPSNFERYLFSHFCDFLFFSHRLELA